MVRIAPYHSLAAEDMQRQRSVYHDRQGCPLGRRITVANRRDGTGQLAQCEVCCNLDRLDQPRPGDGGHSGGTPDA